MKCLKCNVDLGEEYIRCPLCGAPAADIPATIAGLRTAEYPTVVYRPFPRRFGWLLLAGYLVVSAMLLFLEWILIKKLNYSLFVIFLLPCIWSMVIRPFVVEKRYIGSYVLHNIFYASIFMLYFSYRVTDAFYYALYAGIPVLCAVGILVLLVGLFLLKDMRTDAISYVLALLAVNLPLLIAGLVSDRMEWYFPCTAVALGLITLGVIKLLCKKAFDDEFKARFHA